MLNSVTNNITYCLYVTEMQVGGRGVGQSVEVSDSWEHMGNQDQIGTKPSSKSLLHLV